MIPDLPPLVLTVRFTEAVEYARRHHTEHRKGTIVPYMAHLIGVAALVMGEHGYVEFPVTEEMVLAAVLHDVAEDHGGRVRLEEITVQFGGEVSRMVEGLSDSLVAADERKAPWHERKSAYLERLKSEPPQVRLISAADKLYNARATLEDFRLVGPAVWARFKRPAEDQMRYFRALREEFERTGGNRLTREFGRVLLELERLSVKTAK